MLREPVGAVESRPSVTIVWVTVIDAVGVAAKAYSARSSLKLGRVGVGDRIASVADFADDRELAGIDRAREHGGGERRSCVVVVSDDRPVSACPVTGSTDCVNRRCCTFSHLSPSMMSSPPLPWISVAAVAAEDDVARAENDGDAALPSTACRPAISGDALRRRAAAAIAFGAALGERQAFFGERIGPLSTSLNRVPDRPSTDSYSSRARVLGQCRSSRRR